MSRTFVFYSALALVTLLLLSLAPTSSLSQAFAATQWTQRGGDIPGQAAGDESGVAVSSNSDGTIVAIGAHKNQGTGTDGGHVRVWAYSAGSWTQRGGDINAEAANDFFGSSLSLSSDGTWLAVGAPGNDGTASNAGHVRVFRWIANAWSQQGGDIDGESGFDASGTSVALSGDGTTVARTTPVAVFGGYSFVSITAGYTHTCGVQGNGFALCWGENGDGQLGDGTTISSSTPLGVNGPGLSAPPIFASLSAGYRYTCGVTGGGAAYCWGDNRDGKLGDNSTTARLNPTLVAGGHSFTSLAAGYRHTCGVTGGGAGYCWGNNTYGQLGDGTTVATTSPVAVNGGHSFNAIAVSDRDGSFSFGLTSVAGDSSSSSAMGAPVFSLSFDSMPGVVVSGAVGSWVSLPTPTNPPVTNPNSTFLGWATYEEFPVEIAQRQIDNGWGAYEVFRDDGTTRGVFIPVEGSACIAAPGVMYPIWSDNNA